MRLLCLGIFASAISCSKVDFDSKPSLAPTVVKQQEVVEDVDALPSPIEIFGPGQPMLGYTGVPNLVDSDPRPSFQISGDESVDSATGIKCTLPGQFSDLACGGNFQLPVTLVNSGVYNLSVTVTDRAGNQSQQVYTWAFDKTPPVVTLDPVETNAYTGTPTVVQFNVRDTMSEIFSTECFLKINSQNPQKIPCEFEPISAQNLLEVRGQFSIPNDIPGTYEVWVRATDKSENSNESAHATYTAVVPINLAEKTKLIKSIDNKKIDIVIILDSSGSMNDNLAVIAQKFNSFVDTLSGLDWRIGFIINTATVGDYVVCNKTANSYTRNRCPIAGNGDKEMIAWNTSATWNESIPGFDGRLLDIDGAAGTFWIESSTPNYAQLFLNTIQVHLPKKTGYFVGKVNKAGEPVGVSSGQHERSLYAFYRMLERYKDGSFSGRNKNFFRPSSHVAVINVSDEDESNFFQRASGDDPLRYFDPSKYLLDCISKLELGKPCQIRHQLPSAALNHFRLTFPNKNFVWNSIVQFPNAGQTWQQACANKVTAGSGAGCYYRDMALSTGGKVVDINTTATYTKDLQDIGEVTKQLARKAELDCAPYEGVIEVSTGGKKVDLPYTVTGKLIEFKNDLPANDYTIKYNCLVK